MGQALSFTECSGKSSNSFDCFFIGSNVRFYPEDLGVVSEGAGTPVLVSPSSRDDALLPWIGLNKVAPRDNISE